MWEKAGMKYFWGDYFDSRFYIASLISKNHKPIFLDIGCGPGILLKNAHASLKIGVDLSFELLKRAKKLDPDFQLICCDVNHLPLRDNYFPNIMAIHIVSAVGTKEERIRVCNEIQRVASADCEIILNGANRLSKHFAKTHSMERRKKYLKYLDLVEYFKEFEINAMGYGDYSRKIFLPIRKLFYALPEKFVEVLGIENMIFRILSSEKAPKNGRSYILICRRGNKIHNETKS